MTRLTAFFKSRAFGAVTQPGLRFEVERLSWAAVGGPKAGRLACQVEPKDINLDILSGLVRCPVEIYSEAGRLVWWGYVHGFSVQDGAARAGFTFDNLVNRGRVAYGVARLETLGGVQAGLTAWANDTASQAAYGIKEQTWRLPAGTAAQAAALRDVKLSESARPAPKVTLGVGSPNPLARPNPLAPFPGREGGMKGGASVVLELRGWWETLSWKYYAAGAGLAEWVVTGVPPLLAPLGQSAYEGLAESFVISAPAWRAEQIWISARKSTVHTDTITAALCADTAGAPGAVLASGDLTGADFSLVNPKWNVFTLTSPYVLTAGVTYWVKLTTSGNILDVNCFRVLVDAAAGYSGAGRRYNGAAWGNDGWDLQFKVAGSIETSNQIALMAAAGGQFLTGLQVDQATGVWTNPYRSGDQTTKAEIESLLQSGTSAGVRLLAEINAARALVTRAQPANTNPKYSIRRDGVIRLLGGAMVEPGPGIAGEWAEVNTSWMVNSGAFGLAPGRAWLESVEWTAGGVRAVG